MSTIEQPINNQPVTKEREGREQSTNNTTIRVNSQGQIEVVLYKTPIVTFDEKVITLNTGGLYTPTTIDWMNRASDIFCLDYHVYVDDNDLDLIVHSGGLNYVYKDEVFHLDRFTSPNKKLLCGGMMKAKRQNQRKLLTHLMDTFQFEPSGNYKGLYVSQQIGAVLYRNDNVMKIDFSFKESEPISNVVLGKPGLTKTLLAWTQRRTQPRLPSKNFKHLKREVQNPFSRLKAGIRRTNRGLFFNRLPNKDAPPCPLPPGCEFAHISKWHIDCFCGNTELDKGFYRCDEWGRRVKPHEEEWLSAFRVCNSCARVIHPVNGFVVGRRNFLTYVWGCFYKYLLGVIMSLHETKCEYGNQFRY